MPASDLQVDDVDVERSAAGPGSVQDHLVVVAAVARDVELRAAADRPLPRRSRSRRRTTMSAVKSSAGLRPTLVSVTVTVTRLARIRRRRRRSRRSCRCAGRR